MMTTRLPEEIAELPRVAANYEQGVESPELDEQVEIENSILDAWVTFKTTPYLVERIYNGESLDVNIVEVRDEVVIPELERQQEVYVQESAVILGEQIPELKGRLGNARRESSQADAELEVATAEQAKEYPSPRIVMQIPEVRKRAIRHRKDVTDLTGSIHNRQLKVQTNVAVRAGITELLEDPTSEEMFTRVDHITHAAKKAALREVIDVYIQKEGLIEAQKSKSVEDEALQLEYLEKIRVLNNELDAMESARELPTQADDTLLVQDSIDTGEIVTIDSGEIEVIPTPALDAMRPERSRGRHAGTTRNRMFGGLGIAWAWAGAAVHQK